MNIKRVLSVVGLAIFFIGLSMLASLAVALYFRDGSALSLATSSLVSMVTGYALFFFTARRRHEGDLTHKDGFGIVGLGWLGFCLAGSLPFVLSGSIPDFSLAFFEAASGLTTTGSTILNDIEALPKGILFWRSFLHWLGGMGIIVLSVAILPFLGLGGMQMYKAESPGPTKDKLQPRIQQTAKFLWLVYVLISVLCFVLLSFSGMDWYDAATHTFGTVATGGFSTYNASVAHFNSPLIEYIIIFFMFLSGISFALHYRALSGKPLEYLQTGEVRFYVYIIAVATLLIYLSRANEQLPLEQNLRETLFQVVSIITTTGYGTADFEVWQPAAQMVILILMLVGGCAGSTGGGLKVVRFMMLGKYMKTLLYQQLHPNGVFVIKMDGQMVKRPVIQNILGFFMIYLVIILVSCGILTLFGVDLVTAFTAALSCVSNIGPGLAEIGPTDNFSGIPTQGIWVLSFCMIMGRLEIFALLMLFLPQTWRR